MAKSKDDIKYGTAQAKLSEDEMLRVNYKHGTPLEGGKIADSEPVDIFSGAHNISKSSNDDDNNKASVRDNHNQPRESHEPNITGSGGHNVASSR
ncbi:hypothetical protein ACOSP7_031283 [Xanthoceras sorbifolium]|uniref:Seed maturation protein n=1 Tax=Xanthoceras sorbifolium TaxID=99658 RepID=A0ABQ8H0Z2_9ROSI|nr:hypothetical protein JRO89_XS15G0040600 [Xanthoceras sorbifolium]